MDKWVYVEPKKWDSPLHVCISKWKLEAESNADNTIIKKLSEKSLTEIPDNSNKIF